MSAKTIAFFGATGGCGLAALKHSLADGHTCIALCRTPSKLTDQLPVDKYPNLTVMQGNAHDVAAVSKCVVCPTNPQRFVDHIVSAVGGAFSPTTFSIDDPHVCERATETLLQAITAVRQGGASGTPRIAAISTTGISKTGRDLPVAMFLLYRFMLGVPHKDKEAMEDKFVASGEDFVLVRPSFLVDGKNEANKQVRVGVEDVRNGKNVVEKKEWGYTISREAVGRWIYQNLIRGNGDKEDKNEYSGRAVSLTF
ncbi:putative NAD(P)-binding protein [Seiridium cardinale]